MKLDKEKERLSEMRQQVLRDFSFWLANQMCYLRRSAKNSPAEVAQQKRAKADVLRECLDRLQEIRKSTGEIGQACRCRALSNTDDASYNPTPEEIAAKCREIQAEWTESERARRHWQTAKDVELNPTTFIF